MPHQCTTCGNAFPDGSKEMLSGCPDCGGNKFQFLPGDLPDGSTGDGATPQSTGNGLPSQSAGDGTPSAPSGDRSHVASAVEKAADTLRDFVVDRTRPSMPGESVDGASVATGSSTGSKGVDAANPQPETTQATLDALSRDAPTDEGGDAEPTGSPPDEDGDVASRWPSVGTEEGVETAAREEPAVSREWPDPWAPDDDGDDLIVAPPSTEGDTTVGGSSVPPTAASDEPPASIADEAAANPADEPAGEGGDADSATPGHDAETIASGTSAEDRAQADARTSMVDTDDLPDRPASGRVVDEPTGERPDLAQLREELNDQFESIRVVAPGQYELNLMELYDREEYIIAIQENGRYVIEVPGNWEQEEA